MPLGRTENSDTHLGGACCWLAMLRGVLDGEDIDYLGSACSNRNFTTCRCALPLLCIALSAAGAKHTHSPWGRHTAATALNIRQHSALLHVSVAFS